MFITLAPQLFDVGVNYFAVLSPVNCAAVQSVNTISSASVRYYALATVADVDADNNGYIDSTENLVGVTPVKVNYSKGWTCVDVPSSWNWKKDSVNYWTYP
jgi:hypothetical protein